MYILGYLSKDNRVYLTDKDISVISFAFPQAFIEYQSAVIGENLEAANHLLPTLTDDQRNKAAVFLETRGLFEEAFSVSKDPEHRFELASKFENVEQMYELAQLLGGEDRWRLVGDVALKKWRFDLAEECMNRAGDLDTLMMMYQAKGDFSGMAHLSERAGSAFMSCAISY